jgi:NAD(P)-dependent dehydrogenase (short-subunit alcohol dehydrogenase family)
MARTKSELDQTAKEVKSLGRQALVVKGDVCSSSNVKSLVQKTMSRFNRIDILVNNAGIAISKPLIETSEDEWDKTVDTNLKGVFLCSKEVLPHMIEAGEGVIVNISSGAGKRGFAGIAAYCASKFGVNGLTESLAKEVGNLGIRVYAICPGAVNTKMQDDIHGGMLLAAAKMLMIQPEKIAKKVLEMCDPNSKAKTGSCMEVYF